MKLEKEYIDYKEIPYFDHSDKSIYRTVRNSSRRRNISVARFIFRKMKNIFLYWIAYTSPLNTVRKSCHRWRGVQIGHEAYIGQQCIIDNAYPEYVTIEDKVAINPKAFILAHTNPFSHFQKVSSSTVNRVIIGKGSSIGIGAIVLPGVKIGKYCIISAGAVVSKSIPDYSIVSGNPAKIVTTIPEDLRPVD